MERTRIGAAALVLLAAGCVLGVTACGISKTCTLMGCVNGARLHVTQRFATADLAGATFAACRGAVCGPTIVITAFPKDLGDGTSSLEVSAEFTGDRGQLADGDVWTLKVTRPDGSALFAGTGTARYTKGYPNGQECDGDYYCLWANVEVRPSP